MRIALTFEKINDTLITAYTDYDDIDLRLIDPNGNSVASSISSRGNMVIIDCTIPTSGNYTFWINSYRFIHEKYDDLYYYYSWNTD